MKLGGWTRLGLIISVLWFGAITYMTVSEYHSIEPENQMTFVHWVKGTVVDKTVYVDKNGKKTTDVIWDVKSVYWKNVLSFFLIPMSFIWIFIPVVSFLYRWVKVGFKKKG